MYYNNIFYIPCIVDILLLSDMYTVKLDIMVAFHITQSEYSWCN
jgi:hypothetical protein